MSQFDIVHGGFINNENIDEVHKKEIVREKMFRELYREFRVKLWQEHDDVLGNDMVDIGTAEDALWELLLEYGLVGVDE